MPSDHLRDCEDLHWELTELGVDHACGLVSLLRVIGGRLGVGELPDVVDVMINPSDAPRVSIPGVTIEFSLVPNVQGRAVYVGGAPFASLEDLVVSVVVNRGIPWYLGLVRKLLSNGGVRESLNWEWVYEILDRFNAKAEFMGLVGDLV
ncbi:hypothetical protein [Vulcanisaeta thermophila]|uniref:hypothetical protein n=1 Tax=Vulcanisaeta thermophila TaxID=867917 RepID=UPI0009FBEE64|nr:hypothetical protein [Vulcanisaeta thermophila]